MELNVELYYIFSSAQNAMQNAIKYITNELEYDSKLNTREKGERVGRTKKNLI